MRLSALRVILAVQWTSTVSAWGSKLKPRSSTPSPISIMPSQNWDGDDGPWSSFDLQIGTPIQVVRVFVSAASPDTWVVGEDGCLPNQNFCDEARGRTFNPNASSTWDPHGSYQAGFDQTLGLNVQGLYGNDSLGLGLQGSGGPILKNQIIAAYTSPALYVGMFGVNPSSTNFSATDQGRPSYMTSLMSQNMIPSLSFGYTAGNKYRLKQVYGSLTLGGYDSSLFAPNALSVPLAQDPERSLLVGIQSISAKDQQGTTSALVPTPIIANIDSTVSMIWLPTPVCQLFEKVFNLKWDEKTELYLVDDNLHTALQQQNASVTFTLGATISGGQTVDITLPYHSFDLLIGPPFRGISQSQRYFPLRRASNETQYTLGRTFLQEAYLTVDWERRNYSISQCVFSDNSVQTLVPIISPTSPSSSSMSTGTKIGIAVGVVIAVILIALAIAALVITRRRKARFGKTAESAKNKEDPSDAIRQGFAKGELGTGFDNTRFEMEGSDGNANKPYGGKDPDWVDEKARYPGDRSKLAEVEGGDARAEMATDKVGGFYGGRVVHEMYDPSSMPPIELPASSPREEMEGSTPGSSPRRSGPPRSPFTNPSSPLSRPPSSRPSPIHKDSPRSRSSLFGSFSRRGKPPSRPSSPSLASSSAGPSSPTGIVSPNRRKTVSPPNRRETVSPPNRNDNISPPDRSSTVSPPQHRSNSNIAPPDARSHSSPQTFSPVSRQGTFSPPPAPPHPLNRRHEDDFMSPISPEEESDGFGRYRGLR